MVIVAAFQIKLRELKENYEIVKNQCEELRDKNVDFLCLPEKWNSIDTSLELIGDDSSFLKEVSNLSKKYGLYIILGALSEKSEDKTYVTSYFFDNKGKLLGKQRKIHLYSFENRRYSKGTEFKIFDTEFGKIGIAVCFDLNAFPEVARAFALKGTDIIFNPVMVYEEGIENWHIYLKSRALENRLPIVGVNSIGKAPSGHIVSGESLLISFKKGHESPAKLNFKFGKKSEEELIISDIDLDYPRKIRKKRLAEMQEFKIN
ncbi:MAG: carbon-nitrogen hydrolase family protein [Candidatus Lokiarchaeota archaeon]|nr:carbon-nitrogen hydrolase family protein [Candidatus Lokiarchaeota archaeon]